MERASIPTRLRALKGKLTLPLVWDAVMVYLAVLNLSLIAFDLTYLWVRPFYFRHVEALTRLYDPIKGIQPHPVTWPYVELAEEVGSLARGGAAAARLAPRLEELRRASHELLSGKPFERSGQSGNLVRLEERVRHRIVEETGVAPHEMSSERAFDLFWSPPEEALPDRVAFFDRELRPLLEVNYYRRYDLDGELVDDFWWIDLPFLALFIVEFGVRWLLAARRREYPRWFFFPILNWYDLLGIIPLKQFRIFRLFRIASIYVRLHRSQLIGVGDDAISRTAKYFANIISEEISDMVSLRILNETQEEIRDGAHARIIRAVIEPRCRALASELTLRLRDALEKPEVRDRARLFLRANLERSVQSAAALRRLPLPAPVLRPLVRGIGELVFDAIAETLRATLGSEEGRTALEEIVEGTVHGIVEELTDGELEGLVREVALEVLEEMKTAVAVRKWMLPDATAKTDEP